MTVMDAMNTFINLCTVGKHADCAVFYNTRLRVDLLSNMGTVMVPELCPVEQPTEQEQLETK